MTVKLIWITPNAEQTIGDSARVSAPENQGKDSTALIKYLISHKHWSPLEMANMCVEINTTRDIARQILRHRSFSFQEFSQRYAAVDKLELSPIREARLQDKKNRQNSIEFDDKTISALWEYKQDHVRRICLEAYNEALASGIAKEVARAVLPEGLTASRMYMNGSIRSWVHFYNLRSGNGTQRNVVLLQKTLAHFYRKIFRIYGTH